MAVARAQQPGVWRAERLALAVVLLVIVAMLSGCGGGGGRNGGGGTTTTTTTTLPTGCSDEQNDNRCQHCPPGSPSKCLKCEKGYGLKHSGFCEALCLLPNYTKPSPPHSGMHNGIAWPDQCVDDTESNFFAIGDWGGQTPGVPVDNRAGKRPLVDDIEKHAQSLVANVMNARAQESKPRFVLNVGDSFYWGGISEHKCGDASNNHALACGESKFQTVFENIYKGEGMDGVPWYSVLGNHDYGGYGCGSAWDLQVFRTYCPNSRWRMPGLWWSQKVQFRNFAVDIFFLDSNAADIGTDPAHNICNPAHCGACPVPNASWSDAAECDKVMKSFWPRNVEWLEAQLKQSTADWRIAVTHFPPTWNAADWKKIAKNYPLDLIVAGHTHIQQLFPLGKADPATLGTDFQTTFIITGGGGGITSEAQPDEHGRDDQYGFVEFVISRTSLDISMISHGGVDHTKWINRTTTKLVPRRSASNAAALATNAAVTTTNEELVI